MLNKVILMGRITADLELKTTQNGISVISFTLAVNRNYGKGSEQQTDFIDIVAWRNTAEFVSKYFTKGQLVAVAGALQTRLWTDKDGNKRKSVEVVADEVHFAEAKRDSSPKPAAQAAETYNFPAAKENEFEEISSDEELPF